MNTIEYFKERFDQLQSVNKESSLNTVSQRAFNAFNKMGIPAARHEEWKYTRINSLFAKEYEFPFDEITSFSQDDLTAIRLPGHEQANELIFVNGVYSSSLSTIVSEKQLIIMPLEDAAKNEYKNIVSKHLGHSSNYLKDGINALNTAFVQAGVFIYVHEKQILEHPVYIYHITDARSVNTFSQPRSLVYLGEQAHAQLVQTFVTIGSSDAFTNEVMEIVVEKDARLEYYKIQNE
ncbi:MAG: SufD family Fe-S cluster assembly protein, partial [Chitinophagaceae bacterium]